MIPYNILKRLQANWGEKADAMECNCECCIYDPFSHTTWYPYAQDTSDLDRLLCIEVDEMGVHPANLVSYEAMQALFGLNSEYTMTDDEFRPRQAAALYKELKNRYDA